MSSLVLFLVLFVGIAGGAFLGLLICANITVGNFSFEEPGKDIVRCVTVGLITAGAAAGLLAISSHPRVVYGALPVWFIVVKLCWLQLEKAELGIVAISTVLWLAVVGALAIQILR